MSRLANIILGVIAGALLCVVGLLAFAIFEPEPPRPLLESVMAAGEAGTTTPPPATTTAPAVAVTEPRDPGHLLAYRGEALLVENGCRDDGPADAAGAAIFDPEIDLLMFALLERVDREYSDECLRSMATFMIAVGFDGLWSESLTASGGDFVSADGNYRAVVVVTAGARIVAVNPNQFAR